MHVYFKAPHKKRNNEDHQWIERSIGLLAFFQAVELAGLHNLHPYSSSTDPVCNVQALGVFLLQDLLAFTYVPDYHYEHPKGESNFFRFMYRFT